MDDDPYEVVAISRTQQCSILQNGLTIPWETMLDDEGEETDDAEEAVSAVHSLPDGSWVMLDLDYWDEVTLH